MVFWMVHLRIADFLLPHLKNVDQTAFVMGNTAPDSGVPNADWSQFSPPYEVSHFKTRSLKGTFIDMDRFCERHFSEKTISRYSVREYSFFLGCWAHLQTDIRWLKMTAELLAEKYPELHKADKRSLVRAAKEDWYDLDFLYLEQHPDIKAFCVFKHAEGFANTFMDIFSPDAFENRRQYICSFYHSDEHGILQREYPYLTEEQAAAFVKETSMWIPQHMPSPA